MKKITSAGIVALLLGSIGLTCFFFLAADVRVPGATVYGVIGRSKTWSGTVNNTFITDLSSPNTGVCYSFLNSDTGAHTVTINAYVTSDPSVTTFTGNTIMWEQVSVQPTTSGASTYSFPATALTQIYVRTPGAFRVALQISGGAGTGTVDILYAQTGTPCGSGLGVIGSAGWAVTCIDGACSAATTSIVAGVTGVRHVVSCVSGSSRNGGTASTATFVVRDGGNAANCATGTIVWQAIVTEPATIGASQAVAVCGLNIAGTPGSALQLCATNIVAGENQRASMSGFDTQ